MEQGRLEDELGTFTVQLCECVPAPSSVQARAEIVRLQSEGYGPTHIARSLNARAIPTPSGRGRWYPESVQRHVNPQPWARQIARYRARRRANGGRPLRS